MSRVDRADIPPHVTARAPLAPSSRGGSGSFLVRADDGGRYWCKTLNNGQSPRVPVTEHIVGTLGAAIGIPVCEVKIVRIPGDLVGWQFRPGHNPPMLLEEGYAHGSAAVEGVTETNALADRDRDENARRHAGFFALHDWLAGGDVQWLIAGADEHRYWSHDHGHYLAGPDWTSASLAAAVGGTFELQAPTLGLDAAELRRLAGALGTMGSDSIPSLLRGIPVSWPVTDDELDAVVDFADRRRIPVAERLSRMADAQEGHEA